MTNTLNNADFLINRKIQEINTRSSNAQTLRTAIQTLSETAQRVDKAVQSAIATNRNKLFSHKPHLRPRDTVALFYSVLNRAREIPVLRRIIKGVENLIEAHKTVGDIIRDWWREHGDTIVTIGLIILAVVVLVVAIVAVIVAIKAFAAIFAAFKLAKAAGATGWALFKTTATAGGTKGVLGTASSIVAGVYTADTALSVSYFFGLSDRKGLTCLVPNHLREQSRFLDVSLSIFDASMTIYGIPKAITGVVGGFESATGFKRIYNVASGFNTFAKPFYDVIDPSGQHRQQLGRSVLQAGVMGAGVALFPAMALPLIATTLPNRASQTTTVTPKSMNATSPALATTNLAIAPIINAINTPTSPVITVPNVGRIGNIGAMPSVNIPQVRISPISVPIPNINVSRNFGNFNINIPVINIPAINLPKIVVTPSIHTGQMHSRWSAPTPRIIPLQPVPLLNGFIAGQNVFPVRVIPPVLPARPVSLDVIMTNIPHNFQRPQFNIPVTRNIHN